MQWKNPKNERNKLEDAERGMREEWERQLHFGLKIWRRVDNKICHCNATQCWLLHNTVLEHEWM